MHTTTDDTTKRETRQAPMTEEERRRLAAAQAQAAAHERRNEGSRVLRRLRSNPYVWAFSLATAQIMERAEDVGGNGMGDPPVDLLTKPLQELVDRVKLCRRVEELRAEGVGYVVTPQYGPALKEEAR